MQVTIAHSAGKLSAQTTVVSRVWSNLNKIKLCVGYLHCVSLFSVSKNRSVQLIN